MNNKKGIMFFASLLILVFHLWIYIFNRNNIEIFIRSICYIGVDLFFIVSSISISNKDIKDYKKFIKERFIKIYLIYIIFSIINYFITNWSIKELLLTITGINMFISGGGSFLWFIPALMLVYILLPLYRKIEDRHKVLSPIILTILWSILVISLSIINYKSIFIILNRIPIIIIGYYIGKYNLLKTDNKIYYGISMILLIIGIVILYNTRYLRLIYVKDIYYLTAIPFIVGLLYILDKIKSNKITDKLGSITLEMYIIQMMFGFKIANYIYKCINIKLLSNIVTIVIILILSYLLNKVLKRSNK